MRDFEFIHAGEDISPTLAFAVELGLIIRYDEPTKSPEPHIVTKNAISLYNSGVFMLYRPEWIFGDLQYQIVQGGHNKGKYDQSPAVNCVSITLYFAGERTDSGKLRLGSGNLGRDIDWYRPSDHTVRPAPADVQSVFNAIRKHMDTRKRLRGGVHNYAVLEAAWKKLIEGSAMPPFDYIAWPPAQKTR